MTIVSPAGSIGSELISNQTTSHQDNTTTSSIVLDSAGLRKKRDFFNGTTASMQTELDNQTSNIMEEASAVSPKSERGATNANSRTSGFMITDILSNANRGQAAAAAADGKSLAEGEAADGKSLAQSEEINRCRSDEAA